MTGEILTRSYVRYTIPRSSAKVMDYVFKELKVDCPCSLELDGAAKTDMAAPDIAPDAVASRDLYSFPHGAG